MCAVAHHLLHLAEQASLEVRKQIVNKFFGGVSVDGTPGLVRWLQEI